MKKNLLFGFLAASALLGAAPLANAGVVLEEDFNQFTDGTTSKPGNVDIAASGKLGDVLLGRVMQSTKRAALCLSAQPMCLISTRIRFLLPIWTWMQRMAISASHCV
jgi:hypothetical protein